MWVWRKSDGVDVYLVKPHSACGRELRAPIREVNERIFALKLMEGTGLPWM